MMALAKPMAAPVKAAVLLSLAAVFAAGCTDPAAARRLHVTRHKYRASPRYAYSPGSTDPAFAAGTVLGLVGAGIAGASAPSSGFADAPAPGTGTYRPGYYGPGYGSPGY